MRAQLRGTLLGWGGGIASEVVTCARVGNQIQNNGRGISSQVEVDNHDCHACAVAYEYSCASSARPWLPLTQPTNSHISLAHCAVEGCRSLGLSNGCCCSGGLIRYAAMRYGGRALVLSYASAGRRAACVCVRCGRPILKGTGAVVIV